MISAPVPAIDVHTHLFPDRLMAAVRRALGEMYGWEFDLPAEPHAWSEYVRARGTERFCVLPYAHKPGVARGLNAWMAETTRALPGAIGFACVHQDDDDKIEVLTEAFDAGLRGVKLHHQVQLVAPADERLFPVYELMLERDLPLLVHAGRGPTDVPTTGVARFRELMERYPTLRVCVAHVGFPEPQEFLALTRDYPNVYVDTSGVGEIPLTDLGIEEHVDRVLFGTDGPNLVGGYERAITRITDLKLGEDAERAIFRGNALRFLGLEGELH